MSLAWKWWIASSEQADGVGDIDVLPEQVRRVEVRADPFVSRFAQAKHPAGFVHQHVGVHLDGDVDTVVGGVLREVRPVGDPDFFPLVLVSLVVFAGPRRRDPVGHLVVRSARWQPRKTGYRVDA